MWIGALPSPTLNMPVSETYTAGDELLATQVITLAKAINRGFFAGKIEDFFGLEADVPTGWLLADSKTVGDASSNATARANADMSTLFAILWAVGNADGTLSIYTSAGAGSTYGANAAADFAAHKAIALPDLRGRVAVGNDDMGGSDAGRIVNNDTQSEKVGGSCGSETVSIAHTHNNGSNVNVSVGDGSGGYKRANNNDSDQTGSMSANSTPEVMQPTMFVNKIIATGVVW